MKMCDHLRIRDIETFFAEGHVEVSDHTEERILPEDWSHALTVKFAELSTSLTTVINDVILMVSMSNTLIVGNP